MNSSAEEIVVPTMDVAAVDMLLREANLKRSEVYVEPRVGAYLYAIYNTKLNANVGWAVNKFIGKPLLRYDLSVRTQLNKNSALFL